MEKPTHGVSRMESTPEEPAGREGDWLLQRVIQARTLMVSGTIVDNTAREATTQALLMQEEDAEAPITVIINSPGGGADAGFAVFDLLRFIKPPVRTICTGLCASAAILIFLAAERSARFALPNTRFMLHQPSTLAMGPATDIAITAHEIRRLMDRYNSIVAEETKRTLDQVNEDVDHDFWLSAEEALKYKLVGKVITSFEEVES